VTAKELIGKEREGNRLTVKEFIGEGKGREVSDNKIIDRKRKGKGRE
jgi:hypothetical protein